MDSIGISSISYVDIIIAGTFLLFVVFGIIRGFTNDILSLMTWLGATFITKEIFPYAQPMARKIVSEPFFSDVILGFVVFILTLIFLVFIAKSISNIIRKSALSGLDRTMGILSGSLRAVVMLVASYYVSLLFFNTGRAPREFQDARLIATVHIPAQMIHRYLIPRDLFPKRLLTHLYGAKAVYKSEHDVQGLVEALSSPKPGNPQSPISDRTIRKPDQKSTAPQDGYQRKDRQELESLIQEMATKE